MTEKQSDFLDWHMVEVNPYAEGIRDQYTPVCGTEFDFENRIYTRNLEPLKLCPICFQAYLTLLRENA